MKIAIIVNRFPTLSETFIVNKVIGLQKAGLEVTVWVQSLKNDLPAFSERKEELQPVHVKASLLASGKLGLVVSTFWLILRHPVAAYQCWQQAAQRHPNWRKAATAWLMALPLKVRSFDLIHFEFSGLACAYLDALPLLHPARLVTSCRGAAEQITPLLKPERILQLQQVFSQMDAVHCVSADIQSTAQLYGLQPEKAFINHPAIDPSFFRRATPYPHKTHGPFRIISVGRLHWKKGLEFGLLAIKQMVDAGMDIEYHIIGGGEEEEKLTYLIDRLGIKTQVALIGKKPAAFVRQALENADVFLLPSLSEGLSNAALEAMAMEIPVVSTAAGGMVEAIEDGVDGLIVNPMDPEAIAECLQGLLGDIDLRIRIGQAGRGRVESDFHIERQINSFVSWYEQILRS